MDKKSFYNLFFNYGDKKVVYNSFSNSLMCLTCEEFDVIQSGLEDLSALKENYPRLYEGMKVAGFIIDSDFDELSYLKLKNHTCVFDKNDIMLTVNPTLDCNLKCWYCSVEYAKAVHHGRMSDETVEAVKNHITLLLKRDKIRSLHLDWFGGEPLMYFNEVMVPIAEHACKLVEEDNVAFHHHVTTNASLMNEDMINKMAELRFMSYQITLDGNETHHNLIKHQADGNGTFKTVIRNINMLTEAIPDVCVILRVNYDRKTLYCIEDIIPLLTENAKKHINMDYQKVWQVKCTKEDYEQLEKVKTIFEENGLHYGRWTYDPFRYHKCYADRIGHYVVNYDGRVFKCTARDYGDDKVIGTLQNDGQINWNYNLLGKLFAHATFDNERCLKCKAMPVCMGPCITKNIEAREAGEPIPCVYNDMVYSLSTFVAEEAQRRNLIL